MSLSLDPECWRELCVARYGAVEADFVVADIRALLHTETENGFEYVDNERVMRVSDSGEESLYNEARRRGCCGEYETETGVSPGGHRYRWGFNYGH